METASNNLNNIVILIKNEQYDQEDILNRLQAINNELSQIFRSYGTLNMKDLLQVCFGVKYADTIQDKDKYHLIKKFIHPIGYKIMDWKKKSGISPRKLAKNRIVGGLYDCRDSKDTRRI